MTLMTGAACAECGNPLPKRPPSQARKYCSIKCAGEAKSTAPTRRTCEACGCTWKPKDRYQATRRKTCSPECRVKLLSMGRTGKTTAERTPCAACGALVYRAPHHKARSEKTYCSHSCRGKAATGPMLAQHAHEGRSGWTDKSMVSFLSKMSGEKNPAWKGGVTHRKRRGNYVSVRYVRCPANLSMMARADGYVMEHRLVMAEWVKRPLTRAECVHHLDHNPLRNERANLELWPCNRSHKMAEYGRIAEGAANQLSLTD